MTAPPLQTWLGSVNAWECDEMGHMNVRFYLAKWAEGLGEVGRAIGMGRAFAADALSTLLPVDAHIRFLAEARAGAPLSMSAGVLDVGDSEALIYQEARHADGRPAASYTVRVAHVEARSGKPFPWAARMRDRLQKLRCEAPAHGAPRSIDVARAGALATTARADALGAPIVGRGLVSPDQTDAFGRMRAEFFIGRVSDSVPNLMAQWRAEAVRETGLAAPGAAVLEYRLLPRAWPRAGDLIEVRSGVVDVTEKTQRLVHWLLDPISGEAWCTAEAVAVTFDLQTRKTIAPPPAHRAALMARALPGWTI